MEVKGKRQWVKLIDISAIPIRRHIKVRAEANPFDPKWELYFEQRDERRMSQTLWAVELGRSGDANEVDALTAGRR